MLTTLLTLKSRLSIDPFDIKDDTLLTNLILLVTARFDNQTNRKLAYAQNTTDDFQGDETELRLSRYPVDETQPITFQKLSTINSQQSPSSAWQTVSNAEYVLRAGCVISLISELGRWKEQIRVTYSGGYVLPGSNPPPSTPNPQLPDDLQQSCVEQCAYLYQNKDRLGLAIVAQEGGRIQQFPKIDFLPSVAATLAKYERWTP
jgi:hypothetical protein